MKKIVSILLLIVFISANFSFADCLSDCEAREEINKRYTECMTLANKDNTKEVMCDVEKSDQLQQCEDECKSTTTQTQADCNKGDFGERNPTTKSCCPKGQVVDSTTSKCVTSSNENQNGQENTSNSTSVMGISCDQDQLVNGQCKLNIYDTLGIRKSVRDPGQATSVGLFVQDVVLSATFFIGTLVTVALVVSGIMFIFAASSGKDPANAKKGIIGSLVGLLIVVSSYVIIRLVQYVAKGF